MLLLTSKKLNKKGKYYIESFFSSFLKGKQFLDKALHRSYKKVHVAGCTF